MPALANCGRVSHIALVFPFFLASCLFICLDPHGCCRLGSPPAPGQCPAGAHRGAFGTRAPQVVWEPFFFKAKISFPVWCSLGWRGQPQLPAAQCTLCISLPGSDEPQCISVPSCKCNCWPHPESAPKSCTSGSGQLCLRCCSIICSAWLLCEAKQSKNPQTANVLMVPA